MFVVHFSQLNLDGVDDSDEHVYEYYNKYAATVGLSVRKKYVKKNLHVIEKVIEEKSSEIWMGWSRNLERQLGRVV